MANIIQIEVDYITQVLLVYDQIKVYKSDTIDGTYTELTDSGTRIVLNDQDNLYRFTDIIGITTDYYKTAYFNSDNDAESPLSDAISGSGDTSIQLIQNMQVIVELSADITNLVGQSLGFQQFYFTTPCTPYYSTIRKVRLEIGAYLQNISDDTINLAIFEASLAADALSWKTSTTDFYLFARKEWTTCTASMLLLNNFLTGLKSKRLDNLEVQYDMQKPAELMMDKVQACIDKWEKELKSGGFSVQKPRGFVKGECDPEAPNVGRMWEKGPFVQKIGMSNLRYKPFGARRYIGGYRRNYTRYSGN